MIKEEETSLKTITHKHNFLDKRDYNRTKS